MTNVITVSLSSGTRETLLQRQRLNIRSSRLRVWAEVPLWVSQPTILTSLVSRCDSLSCCVSSQNLSMRQQAFVFAIKASSSPPSVLLLLITTYSTTPPSAQKHIFILLVHCFNCQHSPRRRLGPWNSCSKGISAHHDVLVVS